jgi:hypothetical protein
MAMNTPFHPGEDGTELPLQNHPAAVGYVEVARFMGGHLSYHPESL